MTREEFEASLKGSHESSVRGAWPYLQHMKCVAVNDPQGRALCYIPYSNNDRDLLEARRIAQAIAAGLNR